MLARTQPLSYMPDLSAIFIAALPNVSHIVAPPGPHYRVAAFLGAQCYLAALVYLNSQENYNV